MIAARHLRHLALLTLVATAACSADRAGTLTVAAPSPGPSFNESWYTNVWQIQAVLVGAKGGSVTLVDGTVVPGGLGCEVTVSYATYGATAQSMVGQNGYNAINAVFVPTPGGSGWTGGGFGGSAASGARNGAGGGGSTGIFRDGVTVAIAAGGGGASAGGAGGNACGDGTANGQNGAGTAPGLGARGDGPGTGGISVGTSGTSGLCPQREFSTTASVPVSGGNGGNNTAGGAGGGAGGGGKCGGGGGAGDKAPQGASGGGAGSSYAFGRCANGIVCAPATYRSTNAEPGVTFHWLTLRDYVGGDGPLGCQRDYRCRHTFSATFEGYGTLDSRFNPEFSVVGGRLPGGFTLQSDGFLSSGVYTESGEFTFTVQVVARNASGEVIAMSRRQYSILIVG